MTRNLPGAGCALVEERDESGRLTRLVAGGRVYVWLEADGRHYDGGVTMAEAAVGTKLLRSVHTLMHGSWTEEYRLDARGLPVHIDGVEVRRDEQHRVIACGEWLYAYSGDHLTAIDTPGGVRHITWDSRGRPVRLRDGDRVVGYRYDRDGTRIDVGPAPSGWHRDELGRLWTVTRPDGRVQTTYLWDGFACLGRIDGPPGEPLAAVFSLDPTCTPVRVITPTGVARIPRDAFGEALLDHPDVPGLYGGAHHAGCVFHAARALDPRVGAFTGPDPWNGLQDDPRRASGYRGTLPVEKGAYTVSMNDPVGRVDPTGEASAGLYISTFTWSWQNNLVGWLAMDFVINLLASLFGAIGNREMLSRFGDFEPLTSSPHIGATAVRRDGIWIKDRDPDGTSRAWAYQHMVWLTRRSLTDLEGIQVLDPGAVYEPHLYGSVLHVRPQGNDPFVVRGTNVSGSLNLPPPPPLSWTRTASRDADGRSTARPLWDGCIVPSFPDSAMHLDRRVNDLRGTMEATIAELVPSGAVAFGTIEPRALLDIARTGLGIDVGDIVYFGNGEGVISRVLSSREEGGRTLVRIEDDATGVATESARVREVELQTEEDIPRGTAPAHLDLVASSSVAAGAGNDYDVGDYLRISDGGTQLGARRVVGFEAQFTVDAVVPDSIAAPVTIRTMVATPGGNAELTVEPRRLRIPTTPAPAVGSAIAVTHGAAVIPVFIESQDPADPEQFTVDRDLYTGPSQDGVAVTWQRLAGDLELTANAPSPAGTTVTYVSIEVRRAPSNGFVAFESAGGRTLRNVTGLNYDALVLNSLVPGAADPVHVERFTAVAGGADESVASLDLEAALAVQPGQQLFDAGADTRRLVLHLVGTNAATLTAGDPLTVPAPPPAPTFAGSVMTVPYPAGAVRDANLAVGFPVLLNPGGGAPLELNVVQELWLTLPLDRGTGLTNDRLRVARLADGSPPYVGERVDGFTVTVLPNVAGVGRVQMPQFWAGEIVRVAYDLAGTATTRFYRVTNVEGTTLVLDGDQAVDAGAADVRVTRMNPANPSNGGPWAGIDGSIIAGAAGDQLRVRVWRPSDLGPAPMPIAVVDGTAARPAQVVDDDVTLEIVFRTAPAAPSYTLSMVRPQFSFFATELRREDDAYVISNPPAAVTASPQNVVVAVTYAEDAPVSPISGNALASPPVEAELTPGTVLVPDVETIEVDRRQSLVDHELTHTIQSARWGPILLCFLPYRLFFTDRLVELIPGVVMPEFSPYVPGTLERKGSGYHLTVSNTADVSFAQGGAVEVTLAGNPIEAELGEPEGGAFPLIADQFTELSAGLADETPTPVQVRLQRSPGFWGHVGRQLRSALRLSTHGGVLNATVGWTYGGLFTLLGRLVYAATRAARSAQDFPAQVVESGAALRLTSAAGIEAFRAEERVSVKGPYALLRGIATRAEDDDGALLRLVGNLPSDWTDVRVSLHSTRNPESIWDWHSYYPAGVPDVTRPAQVRVTKIGGSPSLAFQDEVWLRDGTYAWTAKVLSAVDEADSVLVDLNKPVAASIASHEFLLAKVHAGSPGFEHETAGETTLSALKDPLGFLSDDLMNLVGAGWMRWAFDPWGQALGRLLSGVPTDTFWGQLLTRSATLMSTYGWSIAVPGWLIWDREIGPEYMSYTEQEAASASGDMYSPAGRLFGEFEREGRNPAGSGGKPNSDSFLYVGDVARYIYYLHGREGKTLPNSIQDRPGVRFLNNPGLVPNVAADPGRAVPDLLYAKNNANPYAVGTTDAEVNFFAAENGWIPASNRLERASAIYVAFSRPSGDDTHLVTVSSNTPNRARGVEANDKYQPLFFNVQVRDVTVRVSGQTVDNDGTVQLVLGQRARIRVSPTEGRGYAVALLRPVNGEVLRLDGEERIVAQDQARTEAVQINRIHEPDALFTHLRRRLVIPVREFDVEVVDTLPVLNELPENADGIFAALAQNPRPGDSVFVVVPCPIDSALEVDNTTLGDLTAPSIVAVATPTGLADFVGDGVIYQVTFAEADTPNAAVDVVFRVTVRGASPIVLQVQIRVEPA